MEDKLTWTDTVSVYAMHEAGVHKTILKMWGHLRAAIVFFMRHQPGQHTSKRIEKAQEELLAYACLVQKTWNMHELMTHNLHTCLVHLPEQAKKCGPTAFAGEWWLERLMQVFKRVTKYRCTRYPETTAVQHWLLMQALDDVRVQDSSVTKLLDEMRSGRTTTGSTYDNTPGSSQLIGKLKIEGLATKGRKYVIEALKATRAKADIDEDGMAVTMELCEADLLTQTNDLDEHNKAVPAVELCSSEIASIKCGTALIRTANAKTSKKDCHTLVPYSLENPSPAAATAEAAKLAAHAANAVHEQLEVPNPWCQLPEAQAQVACAEEVAALATEAATCAAEAAAHAVEADSTHGFDAEKAVRECQKAAEKVAAKVRLASTQAEKLCGDGACNEESIPRVCSTAQTAAAASDRCMALAAAMQIAYKEPPNPAPPSLCTVFRPELLLKWTQQKNGHVMIRKFAIGNMTELQAVGSPEHGYQHVFCDGTRGRQKLYPSLLTPKLRSGGALVTYKYAVWLDQIECAMVSATKADGGPMAHKQFFIPVHKSSMRG
jgi:hypothetical protein